jgi:hypothetical protein
MVARIMFKSFFSGAKTLGPDDKVLLGALAFRITGTIMSVRGLAAHGLGRDIWTLTLHELKLFGIFFYVMEVFYFTELSLVKVILSLFYLYIFPGTGIRRLLLGTVIFNIVFGVAFVTTAIFQCTPVNYFWNQFVETTSGRCIDINTFGWTNAAISVATDIWMIGIPLSQIPGLNLHWKKKAGVTIMFLTGAL